jgi:hypothetical protein
MSYKDLWRQAFLNFDNNGQVPPLWDLVNITEAKPYELYQLPDGKLPTQETLRLKPCRRQLPLSHIFEHNDRDCALITITFVSQNHRVFCAYTTALNGHTIFCLWERDSSGLTTNFPVDAFTTQPQLSQISDDMLLSQFQRSSISCGGITGGNSMIDDQTNEIGASRSLNDMDDGSGDYILRSRLTHVDEPCIYVDYRLNISEHWDELN